MDLFILCNR